MTKNEPQLLLLPGMDGTGDLFADFVAALPKELATKIFQYPADIPLSYAAMAEWIRSSAPTDRPFVLVAESFSTPLAIGFAATNPPNLKGLVLCAGFATGPMHGLRRKLSPLLALFLSRFAMPDFAMRRFLVGGDATDALLDDVRSAVSRVSPAAMAARLRFVLSCDMRNELTEVVAPILYLRARRDRLVPEVCMKEIRRIRPETQVETLEGPHLILQREPERSAGIVAEFVRQLR